MRHYRIHTRLTIKVEYEPFSDDRTWPRVARTRIAMHPIRKLSMPTTAAADPAAEGIVPAAPPVERRSERRHAQMLRPVTVIVRLVTLSLRGASGRISAPLQPGAAVAMVFASGHCMPATVRWCKGETAGFQFPFPLSIDVLEDTDRHERTERAPRYSTSRAGVIRHGDGREFAIEIGNVSSTGFLIVGHAQLTPGAHVQVCCGTMRPLTCEVRWVRNDHAGLQSSEAISLDEFHDATSAQS
jgi:hypothetical protein